VRLRLMTSLELSSARLVCTSHMAAGCCCGNPGSKQLPCKQVMQGEAAL
jgi:hypothetical protein